MEQNPNMENGGLFRLYQKMADDTAVGIVVSDAETHEVYYTNRSFRWLMHLKSEHKAGDRCYQYVRGRTTPCENCAALKLKQNESTETINYFPSLGIYLNTKSVLTEWEGRPVLVEYNNDISADFLQSTQERDLLNRVPNGIGIFELSKGKIAVCYLNDSYYRMVKQPRKLREHGLQSDIYCFIHLDDRAAVRDMAASLETGADNAACSYRVLCGDQDYHWMRLTASVIRREQGTTTAYCSYADYDETINSRAKLEKVNEELEIQYFRERQRRSVMEKNCVAADCYNVTRDQMLSSSREPNIPKSEMEKHGLANSMELVYKRIPLPEDQKQLSSFFDRDKLMDRFRRGQMDDSVEYRSRNTEGRLCWRRAANSLVQESGSDDLISYTYIYEIDREKRKQLALASVVNEETEYVMLVDSSSGITELVSGDAAKKWSAEGACLFGQMPQSPNFDNVMEKDRPVVEEFYNVNSLKRKLETRPVVTVTYRCQTVCGGLEIKKERAFYLDESKEDIVVVARDITDLFEEEQRQKDALQSALDAANEANEAKSEFLSRMSHDIRTPMNGIIGIAKLVRDSESDEERDRYLSELEVSSKYLLGLVNDILTMSKISEGRIELKPEAVKTDEYICQIIQIARIQAEEKRVSFEAIPGEGIPVPYQFFDPLRTQQIVMNLLNNAIKYTPAGGWVRYTASHVEKDGQIWWRHVISDNGVGISTEFQKTMFSPFSQEDNTQSHLATGTGLGLAICKKLCDRMGGSIHVESALGKGSTFTVELPAQPLSEAEYLQYTPDAAEGAEGRREVSLKGKRVLLCEDNRINRMISEKLLEKEGVLTTSAENGREGVELFRNSEVGEFYAVLMDIRMPVMDGLEAARTIRAMPRPDAGTVTIIAMSANAFEEDVQASLDAGMNDHLAKPVEPERLFEALRRA